MEDLSNTIQQLDLIAFYKTRIPKKKKKQKTCIPTITEHTYSSSVHGTFTKIHHMLHYESISVNFKGMKPSRVCFLTKASLN